MNKIAYLNYFSVWLSQQTNLQAILAVMNTTWVVVKIKGLKKIQAFRKREKAVPSFPIKSRVIHLI